MKFGLRYIPDYHEGLSGSWYDWYEGMIAEVKLAEKLGFHGAWFAEHRVAGFAFGSPAMFIAACARETSRIRLGCSVSLLPLNNPVRTEKTTPWPMCFRMVGSISVLVVACTNTTTTSPTFPWGRAGNGLTKTSRLSERCGRRTV
jgi:hypothetical protein